MSQRKSRAEQLRARAAEFAAKADKLPPEQRSALLMQQRALLELANIEDWVSMPGHTAAKHDYLLQPKTRATEQPRVLVKRGRKLLATQDG